MPNKGMEDPARDWTVHTLRDYVLGILNERYRFHDEMLKASDRLHEQRFTAQHQAVQAALLAAERAVSKAEIAIEKRFDSTNEFRQTLTDQAATFMPRAEADSRLASLVEKIAEMSKWQSSISGAAGQSNESKRDTLVIVGMVVSFVVSVAAIAVSLFKH